MNKLPDDVAKKLREHLDAALIHQHQQIAASFDAIGGGATPSPAGAAQPKVDFCSLWPVAKPILQAVCGILMFIPSVGTKAGPVIAALATVADQTCNKPPE